MRKIGVVTTSRADFGIYLPILKKIRSERSLKLALLVSGTHLSPEFGRTLSSVEEEGFRADERVEMMLSSDTPEGIAKSMGLGLAGFAQVFSRNRPDILVVLGDRFEMLSAALAAVPFKIPIAHIHGGELTYGAMDESFRHAMTKLSHLHFPSCHEFARRIVQMGEEQWRVTVSGAPSLDNLKAIKPASKAELENLTGLVFSTKPLLVTFHPETLAFESTGIHTSELLAAVGEFKGPVVFTMPNADTGGRIIRKMIADFVKHKKNSTAVENLGSRAYYGMMACAAAMVGNSSSGIIEAPSFKLPVVNVGSRQEGRPAPKNVVTCGHGRREILSAILRALEMGHSRTMKNLRNPYGDGRASERIVGRLKAVSLDKKLLMKRFNDQEAECRYSPERKGRGSR